MLTTRRQFVSQTAMLPISLGAIGAVQPLLSGAANAATSLALTPGAVGCINGNTPGMYSTFSQWLGARPQFALLAFNQTNASQLASSVPYIIQQGQAFTRLGAMVVWSVPCPGGNQLEAIVAGHYDSLYTNLFKSILAAYPGNNTHIYVRLPWEFNLPDQENAAVDKNGRWSAALFVKAWQHIATIAHNVSTRFMRIWCPNVTTQSLDPALCWPGAQYVEIVAQDFYMQAAYNRPGDIRWFMTEQRGLVWGKNFAAANGKYYALSEWGMDSDSFVGDFNTASLWLKSLGAKLHHHNWWNMPDVINCVLTNGSHPKLAAAYKTQFA